MTLYSSTRLKAAAILTGAAMLLSGCFIQPGNFTSELELLDSNQFNFTYEGQIHFVGLAKIMEESKRSSVGEFSPYCYGPTSEDAVEAAVEAASAVAEAAADAAEAVVDTPPEEYSYGERECTPEEEAQQRLEWEDRQARRLEKDRQEAEQLSKMTGGIDLTDPEAEQELAKLLLRQKGFERVEVLGDGVFDISYSIDGTLSHDFMFPVMEGFPTNNPFVQLIMRDGNVVRVNAPAFTGELTNNPLGFFMMGAPGLGGGISSKEQEELNLPEIEGTFSIVTTGDIRANNTDEGAVSEAGRQRLTWQINPRTAAAPTALIAM